MKWVEPGRPQPFSTDDPNDDEDHSLAEEEMDGAKWLLWETNSTAAMFDANISAAMFDT